MRTFLLPLATGLTVLATAVAASPVDDEFEKLRAAARKHAQEAAKAPRPAVPAAKPAGPSLAPFVPPAPKGWRMRNNPFDDAQGLVDLSRQASADYVPTSGARDPALDLTLLARGASIGGGAPKLGLDPMSGMMISQVSVAGRIGYLAWQSSTRSGKLTLAVGRYQVTASGRSVEPKALIDLAASVDLGKLATL